MDLSYGPEYETFREEVRDFIAVNRHLAPKNAGRAARPSNEGVAWQKLLIEHGYTARTIPREYGGFGAEPDILKSRIIAEEFARAGVPGGLANQGISMLVPTLLELGTEEQKRRWIEPTLAGDVVWCQGYSEPGSGSDLASLKTSARVEGGDFVVNGQKIWTSTAKEADMIFCLVRTEGDAAKHQGISYLIFPMTTPGIEVRPLRTMTGHAEFNETFFTDARCPADSLIGAPGDGWKIAMGLLAFERGVSTLGQQMGFRNELDEIIAAAKANGAAHDPLIRQRIAKAEIGLNLMRYGALRMLSQTDHSKIDGAALTYKIQWATWRRSLGELAMDVLGQHGEVAEGSDYEWDTLPNLFLYSRADTIYGGTNQIQRNLIAERGLGMPREPRGDV